MDRQTPEERLAAHRERNARYRAKRRASRRAQDAAAVLKIYAPNGKLVGVLVNPKGGELHVELAGSFFS